MELEKGRDGERDIERYWERGNIGLGFFRSSFYYGIKC